MVKNIILISIDTLRYDCVGYQTDKQELVKHDVLKYLETPTLDKIAEKSLCFTQCISTNTYTTSAHASVLSGLYPPRHGVRAFYKTKIHQDVYTLAEILKVFGYKTVMATDTPVNFLPLDLNKGFDHIFDKDDFGVFKFLEEHQDEKIFIFAHFFDVHEPYLLSKQKGFANNDYFSALAAIQDQLGIKGHSDKCDTWSDWNSLVKHIDRNIDVLFDLYIRGVTKFDQNRFKVFLENMERTHSIDDSLLVIFSDHGEGKMFNTHPKRFGHGVNVFDNVIRVPLILHHRDCSHKLLDKLVSLVDIFPTVIEMATEKSIRDLLPYRIDGQSLLTPEEVKEVYSETYLANSTIDTPWSNFSFRLWQRGLRSKKSKFILYGEPEVLSEESISTMDNEAFLKSVYRKQMHRFETYDEYMENLRLLNTGELTKRDFYQKYRGESFEIYDLKKDPSEEHPVKKFTDDTLINSIAFYKKRLLEVSTPSVESEDIFPPVNKRVVEKIAAYLLADESAESLRIVTENTNLFNELIRKFLSRNQDLQPEEFLEKCYRIFLDRTPDGEKFHELVRVLQEGAAKEKVFMEKIFQQIDLRSPKSADKSSEKETRKRSREQELALEREMARKDQQIRDLRKDLEEKETHLGQVLSSKTWRLGQFYGKFIHHRGFNRFVDSFIHKISQKDRN